MTSAWRKLHLIWRRGAVRTRAGDECLIPTLYFPVDESAAPAGTVPARPLRLATAADVRRVFAQAAAARSQAGV